MACCNKLKIKCKAKFDDLSEAYIVISLILFIADIVSDGYISMIYYQQFHHVWGTLTLLFVLAPMIFTSIALIYIWFAESYDGNERHMIANIFLLITSFCFAPFIVVMALMGSVNASIHGEDKAIADRDLIKFLEGILEAFPQSCLQSYIIFHYLLDETEIISIWQWISMVLSIITLMFTIATNSVIHKDASYISRVAILFFGLLSLVSRVLICCLYSRVARPLWFLPIGTEMAVSIITWLVTRFCKLSWTTQLDKKYYGCNLLSLVYIPVALTMTTMFNSFSMSGIPIAIVSLGYAIGGYFLFPGPVAIVAITLAALSLVVNIVLVSIKPFRNIGKDWLAFNEDGESILF